MDVESVDIKAPDGVWDKPWTIEVVHGWPIYTVPEYLSGREALDERSWPRDSAGIPTHHQPVTGKSPPAAGTAVVWKNTFSDYMWGTGVVRDDGRGLYVESHGLAGGCLVGFARYDRQQGCWVTDGACALPADASFFS